ncbi:hypothetical protein WJX81_003476 [Elliptochloris bilobata]|uniref:Uncharacterized protein n=1 Tax=Elliptochloris bilobata TaxID=381761 RepID=A0AAW1SFR9_9CHLO
MHSPGAPPQGQLYPEPVAGIKILPPRVQPGPGQHIIGYEIIPAKANCSCEGFKATGVVAIIILLLIFWPLFWVPLVIDDCFEQTQRPMYSGGAGAEAQGPPTGAVNQAPPYYQGQAPPPGQGLLPHQGPPPSGVGGVVQGEPVHPAGQDPNFPDPVKPPKTTA